MFSNPKQISLLVAIVILSATFLTPYSAQLEGSAHFMIVFATTCLGILPLAIFSIWKFKILNTYMLTTKVYNPQYIQRVFTISRWVIFSFYIALLFTIMMFRMLHESSTFSQLFNIGFTVTMFFYILAFIGWFLTSAFGAKVIMHARIGREPQFKEYLPTLALLLNPVIGIWLVKPKA